MSNSNSKQNENDLSAGISAHEKLIHEHRKFLDDRLKSSPVGSHARDALTAEKNVWTSIQAKELEERNAAEKDADAKEQERERELSIESAGLLFTIILVPVTIFLTLLGTDVVNAGEKLKNLAFVATIFGALSSLFFLLGHRRSVALDGVAKSLAFAAAIIALGAAWVLLKFGF